MTRLRRRWRTIQLGRFQLRWYWGSHGGGSYGWKADRKHICAGPIFATLWREARPGRFKQGWWG